MSKSLSFIMTSDDGTYANVIDGSTPEAAVEAYFEEMDAWCSPPENIAAWSNHRVFALPDRFDDEAVDILRDLDGIELAAEFRRFMHDEGELAVFEVTVGHTGHDGSRVLRVKGLPQPSDD